jgi:ribosomal protein S18 acetylase RimI-like enzyme
MPDLTIRAADPGEIAAVLELWAQARSAAAATADTPEGVGVLLERDPGALLVACLDGRVVGTLIAAWDGWRGSMYRLAVLPGHRRRGIGRRLVDAGHARLRALGATRVTALVAHDEEHAVGLWRAAGYGRDEQVVRFVRNL